MVEMENLEQWQQPEMWHATILTYIFATSKEEFESLENEQIVIVPIDSGTYSITKGELLQKAKEEIQSRAESI